MNVGQSKNEGMNIGQSKNEGKNVGQSKTIEEMGRGQKTHVWIPSQRKVNGGSSQETRDGVVHVTGVNLERETRVKEFSDTSERRRQRPTKTTISTREE